MPEFQHHNLSKGEYSVNVSFWSDTRELLGYEDITMEGNPPKINIVEANVARSGQFNAQGTWSEIWEIVWNIKVSHY